MRYRVKRSKNQLLVFRWVNALNDPLVRASGSHHTNFHGVYEATWVVSVVASGPGETVLLLKYGNILEQVL